MKRVFSKESAGEILEELCTEYDQATAQKIRCIDQEEKRLLLLIAICELSRIYENLSFEEASPDPVSESVLSGHSVE
jgi:hypothetical protein